jgi:hypothetical protein
MTSHENNIMNAINACRNCVRYYSRSADYRFVLGTAMVHWNAEMGDDYMPAQVEDIIMSAVGTAL